ncbi:MAG: STAS domain-containing protein [Nitrospirota bacterium]|nr:STAS domain-containing protein [Nitrospirota bacterium]
MMDASSKQYAPTGDLTIFEVTAFKDSLVELLSCGGTGTLDLSHIGQVDGSALQLIVAVLQTERLCVTGASVEIVQKMKRIGGYLTAAQA